MFATSRGSVRRNFVRLLFLSLVILLGCGSGAGHYEIQHSRKPCPLGVIIQTVKRLTLLALILLTFSFCQAQKLNTLYYGVSSDSLHNGHQLEFKTDTTLEISTFPRHMSKQFKILLPYKRSGKTIKVINQNISLFDSIALTNHGFKQFLKGTAFTVDNKAILDTSTKMVYVRYNDFSKRYYLTYIIDGKTYKQETGLSDAYGLIKSNPKENKALKEKFASINNNLDNYIVNVYKGLAAYNKFGYESVFGVIEMRQKN